MYLYVTRHGKARAESESGLDEDRPLKSRGVRQSEYIARSLDERDLVPEVVYSSGLLRAEQTADLIAEHLNAEREVEPVLGLGHRASDVVEVLDLIMRKDNRQRVMVVGHNPQLESLVGVLLEGPSAPPYRMRTGTCVVLRYDEDITDGDEGLIGRADLIETLRLSD